jgi:hypothetical protein
MMGDPGKLNSGRFSQKDFDRLARHADAQGRLTEEAVGQFIAENLSRDRDAKIFPIGRLAGDLFGATTEALDSLNADLFQRRTARDEAKLLEKLTKLTGEDNLDRVGR